ncbi:MAG: FGGY family carbohydrate kinase [Chloroflexi bacterium]|nr:FGGY family carbohydrate kinase [Chloroflexota bacterium]
MVRVLLGLDLGTTSLKALALDAEHKAAVSTGQHPTPLQQHGDGTSTFDPEALWHGVCRTLDSCLRNCEDPHVEALAIASMGESGLPVDTDGMPLYPAITWFDRRTQSYLPWWEERVGREQLFQITGQLLHHMYGALKIQWLREHEPLVWQKTARWLSIPDYIIHRLTGAYVTDFSIASRTLLFDQRTARWSPELLTALEVKETLLPAVQPSGSVAGSITGEAARQTGLPVGLPVVLGGHDHLVGCLAVGAARPGVVLNSVGTAEGVMLTTHTFNPSPALMHAGYSTYRHVIPDSFVVVAGQHGAGGLINWLLDLLYPDVGSRPYGLAFEEALAVPPGCQGLLCLPHLRGSRLPEHDLQSRAAFVGLVDGHGRGHFLRAALEALGLWLRSALEVLEQALGASIPELMVIGGATRSRLWMEIKAAAIQKQLRLPQVTEAVALGAALLGGIGVGMFEDADTAVQSLHLDETVIFPDPTLAHVYDHLYPLHRELYTALAEINHRLAGMSGEQ